MNIVEAVVGRRTVLAEVEDASSRDLLGRTPELSVNYRIAIDDFGTGKQFSEGWALVVLLDPVAVQLESRVEAARAKTTLRALHGNEYKRRFRDAYREALQALHDALLVTDSGFLVATMLDTAWKNDYREFVSRVVCGALKNAGVEANPDALSNVAAPLFTLQRIAAEILHSPTTARIEIDGDRITSQLSQATASRGEAAFPLKALLTPIYEASRKWRFPNAPEVLQGGIDIRSDADSPLIQVVDLFANFLSVKIRQLLGVSSSTIIEKASLLDEVFGDVTVNVSDLILDGPDDFRLREGGAFKLIVKAE